MVHTHVLLQRPCCPTSYHAHHLIETVGWTVAVVVGSARPCTYAPAFRCLARSFDTQDGSRVYRCAAQWRTSISHEVLDATSFAVLMHKTRIAISCNSMSLCECSAIGTNSVKIVSHSSQRWIPHMAHYQVTTPNPGSRAHRCYELVHILDTQHSCHRSYRRIFLCYSLHRALYGI
ncbi:uncharacterized protein LAESUDRAFT_330472 [Laetiporus sulphureus 93-53]|uniref:Uncharacterized protein n=1 Tax=Laetiporus sulphureus 93-53 TaxID=1314785 RepID=A0A165CXC5_9APHY|nr:uncharacterized protein LAESUDRAFT_330472 [Laetiporus sulphureus 93-53]KZT03658.1 hypothetical protein LAESUDRAFT_330472 [Laetiporus sulphureus 93-53]